MWFTSWLKWVGPTPEPKRLMYTCATFNLIVALPASKGTTSCAFMSEPRCVTLYNSAVEMKLYVCLSVKRREFASSTPEIWSNETVENQLLHPRKLTWQWKKQTMNKGGFPIKNLVIFQPAMCMFTAVSPSVVSSCVQLRPEFAPVWIPEFWKRPLGRSCTLENLPCWAQKLRFGSDDFPFQVSDFQITC